MVMDGFVERARRELSAEELSGLRVYHAQTERGSVVFMPIIRKMGQQVQWTARVYIKGTSGPLPASRASLRAIAAPDSWGEKTKSFLEALQQEFPALPQSFPEQRALGTGESGAL